MELKRLTELLAVLMIGDGVLTLLYPRNHAGLWAIGPQSWRDAMSALTRRPGLTRLLGAVGAGAGLWLAARQYPPHSTERRATAGRSQLRDRLAVQKGAPA